MPEIEKILVKAKIDNYKQKEKNLQQPFCSDQKWLPELNKKSAEQEEPYYRECIIHVIIRLELNRERGPELPGDIYAGVQHQRRPNVHYDGVVNRRLFFFD